MKSAIASLLLLGAATFNAHAADRPVVQVQTGQLQGVIENDMHAFKGVPFSAPPVGELRWRPPQPALPWAGTRDASQFGDSCPQPSVTNLTDGMTPGNEDCLKLNVFTPTSGKHLLV